MATGTGGLEYEAKVLNAIKTHINDTPYKIKPSTAGFSATEVDLILLYKTQQIAVEIKMNKGAQMGGGSYNYDRASGKFGLSAKTIIDPVINDRILSELEKRKSDLNVLLDFAKVTSPVALSSNISGLPLITTKEVWEEITKKRLLVPLNAKVEVPTSFLYDHYKKKGCYYIQIGGLGLYYLHSNPLNLPVPQLKATMQIELRLARAGSTMNTKLKVRVASGNIRAQGRLNAKSLIKSPYSLDKPADFIAVFGGVTEKDINALRRK
jgi:hypothetical protein